MADSLGIQFDDRQELAEAAAHATLQRIAIHYRASPSPTLQRYILSISAFPSAVYGLILLSIIRGLGPVIPSLPIRHDTPDTPQDLTTTTTHTSRRTSHWTSLEKVLRRWV
jgi:hypothetical protein